MKLTDYFDKIFVINLLERKDRRDFMLKQFVDMGLGEDIISNKIEFIEAVPLPCITESVLKKMREDNVGNFYSLATKTDNVGLANCSIEHYRVVKRALLKGYDRILVLEDDACFLKNLEAIQKALDTIPEDFDILHMEGFFMPANEEEAKRVGLLAKSIDEAKWEHSYNFPMFGAAALIYSKRGMGRYIANQEMGMMYSDYYTFIMDADSYFYTYPLVIQQDYIYSDIVHVENNTLKINLYTKYIDRKDYYNIWE